MYHGKTLLPITQYGQAEIDIKMALYSDGKRRKSKYLSLTQMAPLNRKDFHPAPAQLCLSHY